MLIFDGGLRGRGGEHLRGRWPWLAVILVVLLALAVRLPYLWSYPLATVEWDEVRIGYGIAFQHLHPSTDYSRDIGPLYNYLIGGLFRLFGPDLRIPRVVSMLSSVGTVLLTYLIGLKAFGRRSGLLAAAALALSGASVYLAHEGFSDSLTPLMVSVASLLTLEAERKSPWWLAPAGLAWGVALQTDSSVFAFLIPLLIYLILRAGRRILPTLLGLAAFLLGYANMILTNIRQPLVSLHWIFAHKTYATGGPHGLLPILGHYAYEILSFGQSLGSAYLAHWPSPADIGVGFVVLVWMVLFVDAVRHLWREGSSPLTLFLVLGPLLLMPLFNRAFLFPQLSRYFVPVLPWALSMMAHRAEDLARHLRERGLSPRVTGACALVLAGILPLASLVTDEVSATSSQQTSVQIFALADRARSLAPAGTPLYVDSTAPLARYFDSMLAAEGFRISLMGDPWANNENGFFDAAAWSRVLGTAPRPFLAVLGAPSFQKVALHLPPSASSARIRGLRGGYVIVRVGRTQGG